MVFKSPGETDVDHIARVLSLESDPDPDPGTPAAARRHRLWRLTTVGRTAIHSVREHVDVLLSVLGNREAEIARLRKEGYWVSVFYHDTIRPDEQEFAAVSDELEARDITLDFELEREDDDP